MRARRFVLPVLVLTLAAGPTAAITGLTAASASTTVTGTAFSTPVALNDAAGASTGASEPSIHVDSKDNVFVSGPAGVPTGGCPFWSVHPDSLSAKGLPYDYRGTIDTDHVSVGGGDCDISSTPVAGAKYDDVSVTSLSLANLTSNVTTDGGATFKTPANSASQQVFGVDRQWQASDPSLGRHYLTVHDLATDNIQSSVSTDGGYQYVQNTPAINPTEAPGALSTAVGINGVTPAGNHFGPTAVNPTTHKLYIPFLAPGPGENSGTEHAIWVAEGDPCAVLCTPGQPAGPISWTDHLAFSAPAGLSLSNDFPSLTIDKGGVVYVAFTGDVGKPAASGAGYDHNHIFVAHSKANDVGDGAWSAPVAVDPGTANANVFPWLVSGAAGNVGVAWYASTLAASASCPGGVGTATNNPVSDNCRNVWHVAYAQSSTADTAAPEWAVSDVSGTIHNGPVCNQGLACATGTRTLLDFFDVAADNEGRPNFVYASDTRQPGTADIDYTRQCSGTSLTGQALGGPCGPLGTAPACTFPQIVDAHGDATQVVAADSGQSAASQSDLDITDAGMTWDDSKEALVAVVHVADLAAAPGSSENLRFDFTLNNIGYEIQAQRDSTGATTFSWDQPGLNAASLGDLTGSFDNATNAITIDLSSASYASAQPTQPPLAVGSVVNGMSVLSQRLLGVITATADSASAPASCSYVAGDAAQGPSLPEVPYAGLLPVAGLALLGLLQLRRRRTARAAG